MIIILKKKFYPFTKKIKKDNPNKKIYPKDYFTNIKSIGCWLGGSVGVYVKNLNKYYGDNILIKDIGYIASEGRFSIPIKNDKESGILDIRNGFYEFIPIKEYKFNESTKTRFETKLAHELVKGEKYYFIITSENGLYRYFIDDIIEVSGFYKNTPKIKFIQKGKYISSITGEKISEWEIIEAIKKVKNKINFNYYTFFALANTKNSTHNYEYHIEFENNNDLKNIKNIEIELDNELKKMNIEYKEKRDSERLGPIKIKLLPNNSLVNLKHEFSKKSNHDSQVKVPKLIVLEK
ncbi:MAG: GH3 auxin-responsive promoter family protein, partial [Nanoarchaeota archaeon]|nr:GH3 auxin-responsive promoter family protein [Nanoarchaeota archaeon]